MKIAVVIPVHNEAPSLRALTEGIAAQLPPGSFEILFVDDGSTDDTARVLQDLQREYPMLRVLRFSRNAGKSQALASAFRRVHADIVVTMDGDLQDDPVELPRMLDALNGGADVVCGWKANRQDPLHKTLPSRVFNGAIAAMFGLKLHDMNTGFKAMRGHVARQLPLTHGMHRFVPVLARQLGYSVTEIPVRHHPRRFGKSNYGVERYYQGARDALWLWRHPSIAWGGPPAEPEGLVEDEPSPS